MKQQASEKKIKLIEDLDTFFCNTEPRDILLQWKETQLYSFKQRADLMEWNADNKLKDAIDTQKSRIEQYEKLRKKESEIMNNAKTQAEELRKQIPTDEITGPSIRY